jgi:hypothetical protein
MNLRNLWTRPYFWLVLLSLLASTFMIQPVEAKFLPEKQELMTNAGMLPQSPSRTWQIDEVDSAGYSLRTLGRRDIAIDSDDVVHVVYGGGHLLHAWYQDYVWQTETVDRAQGVGGYASIALDSQDGIHIAYYDKVNQNLKYAKRMGGSPWAIQNVDTPGDVGQYASIALGSNNRAHIAYLDATLGLLKYAVDYDGQFLDEDVDFGVSMVGDLALDASGHPHIAYLDTSNNLKYATYNGSDWIIRVLRADMKGLPSLALNSTGLAYIAYPLIEEDPPLLVGGVKISSYDGTTFANVARVLLGEIPNNYDEDMDVSLVIDAEDVLYLSFYDPGSECLAYSENPGWDVFATCVVNGENVGYNSSLAFNSVGYPKIAYTYIYDVSPYAYELDYASYYCTPLSICQWGGGVIDDRGDIGRSNSLALNSSGQPQISYSMLRQNDAWYASRIGGTWAKTLVDSDSDIISNLPLDLDALDHPYLSYFDDTAHNFQIAYDMGSGWTQEVVISGITTLGSSIAMDAQGYPHISYTQIGASDALQYVWKTSTGWHLNLVDTQTLIDSTSSIALDSDNYPHIVYDDYNNIKYAYYDGAQWHLEIIEPFEYTILGNLVLAADGTPHVSYCTGPDIFAAVCDKLRYAYRAGGTWHIQTVAIGGSFGASSIDLYPSGAPAITYYDVTNTELEYATRVCLPSCVWMSEVVDSDGDVGDISALKIAPNGSIHISYHTKASWGLRYAYYTLASRKVFLPLTRK